MKNYDGIKGLRCNIGKEILELMEKNEDLPLPNAYRLSKTMQEYFNSEGFDEDLEKYKWRPDADYWMKHVSDISDYMRKDSKRYFGFVRNQGELTGQWKFMNKKDCDYSLKRNNSDIATRVDNQNENIDDVSKKWKVDVPHIAEVERLT